MDDGNASRINSHSIMGEDCDAKKETVVNNRRIPERAAAKDYK
jgi:hypothetical protein